MQRKIIFGLIWASFIGYAFFFAPNASPDTLDLIINLSAGNWQEINPLVVSLFNLMGILPAIYACLLLFDGRSQKIPAWIFVFGSFGTTFLLLLGIGKGKTINMFNNYEHFYICINLY